MVGYDGRHRSAEFAADAAGVLAAAGFSVLLAPGPLPTPMTAFAVRQLHAAAGCRSPHRTIRQQDNGLKVYLQAGHSSSRRRTPRSRRRSRRLDPAVSIDTLGSPQPWPDDLVQAYLDRAPLCPRGTARTLRVATTPMHGVGGEIAVKALDLAGFTDVHVVAEQAAPDGDFPTVPFPNPEEQGATDLLLALARGSTRTSPSPWTRMPTAAPSVLHDRTADGGCSPATRPAR